MIFDPPGVIHVTWRRVLRTPLPLPEGVPQVCSHKFRSCRARFPADPGRRYATSSVAASRDASVLLFEALARLGGRLRLPGALRRRPRFARQDLASLGLAELRKLLKSAGDNFSSNGTPLAK